MVQTDERRELSAEEIQMYSVAQEKWIPALIPTFSTPLHELMASPLKWSFLKAFPMTLIFGLVIFFAMGMKLPKSKLLLTVIISGLFLFMFGTGYLSQYRKNQDYLMVASLLPPNPTKYDYESSSVVQAKLMRNSISRVGSGSGSLAGGVIGGVIGGRASRR